MGKEKISLYCVNCGSKPRQPFSLPKGSFPGIHAISKSAIKPNTSARSSNQKTTTCCGSGDLTKTTDTMHTEAPTTYFSTTTVTTDTTHTEAPTTYFSTTTVMTSQNNEKVTTKYIPVASNGQSGSRLVVLVTIPVIVLAVLLLMLIGFYWMKSTARYRKRRNRNSTSGNEEIKVKDLEAGKGKTNSNGETEVPFNNYTDAGKQSGIKSKSNGNETKNTSAGQYEEVDKNQPKPHIGGSQGYEEVSNNKTPFYHTLEPDSTSNEAVTSHQDVGYDQLNRGDPSSKANVNATTSAGYDQLNATAKRNTYDLLNRESKPVSQNDVIDANEYSELNEKISSASASYDKLNHKAELSGSIEAVTSPQDVGYDQLNRGDPSSKANVNASTSAGYDQLNATPKSNSYDLLNRESRPASQNDVIDANEYSELNEKISSASASYDKLNHKAELSGSIEAVTSPQDVGYDQLNRGDPSSKANVNASTSAGYDQLNATPKSNSYDLLNRESRPASQNDVIDANEYSELNEQITSA
ncbi:hypothetical protein BSL78_06228 [Apostichopus japonicus]|uniref:Uncharacterized protein n=1 Tax=Stichopus japonicus TaxID=307972 RepID=A0A2G8L995_STIJA|nr:hypothetical protein BSL78_06228 [Apostichopus japonicus]